MTSRPDSTPPVPNTDVLETAIGGFREWFDAQPVTVAYSPGRVEVLGNHTDYNEGLVLSAAINMGTFFLAAPARGPRCRLVAGDVREEAVFEIGDIAPDTTHGWANYVKGVLAGLAERGDPAQGFNGLFLGNIPLGAGLSSSAALEMASGLAFSDLYAIPIDPLDLARIGQRAEHTYAGVKCGLLDQISSLFGREAGLVLTDFRSLAVETLPLADRANSHPDGEVCFLMCNTHASHRLVDGAYNNRRAKCEEATAYFAGALDRPVQALRDVCLEDLDRHRAIMDAEAALRAAHVIGETERVRAGRPLLEAGDLRGFGDLMFASHRSSQTNFENSCPELDFIVDTARGLPGVLGARLSGGGFGGSAVVLIHPRDTDVVTHALSVAYQRRFDSRCDIQVILPSAGGRLIQSCHNDR